MHRLRQIAHRLLQTIPVLLGISLVTFALMTLTPGDPIRLLAGDRASPETIAAIRDRYGLDDPLLVQYATYVGNLLVGDLGRSIRYRVPVGDLIANHLPVTLFLITYAIALALPPTIALSVWAARNQGRLPDQVTRLLGVAGVSIPVFWLGIMMSRLFGVTLGWFPVSGYGTGFTGHLHHLFLPALSTAIWVTPVLVRNLRATLLDQMERDFVTAGRAKGLAEADIFHRHVFRNAVLPTLHLFGVLVAYLLGGTVVVETVYAVPGMGLLMVQAILGRDYFVVQGVTLVFAVLSMGVMLAVDLLSTVIDPRVKL
jgi:peptide/nickel transport system permease protein